MAYQAYAAWARWGIRVPATTSLAAHVWLKIIIIIGLLKGLYLVNQHFLMNKKNLFFFYSVLSLFWYANWSRLQLNANCRWESANKNLMNERRGVCVASVCLLSSKGNLWQSKAPATRLWCCWCHMLHGHNRNGYWQDHRRKTSGGGFARGWFSQKTKSKEMKPWKLKMMKEAPQWRKKTSLSGMKTGLY